MKKKKQCKKNLSKIKSLSFCIFDGSNRLKQVYNSDEADKIYTQLHFYY